ncbi:RNA polymerase sigma factor [Luteolibacter algae]|uniref:RNA polymerase sigma factor n=1 Tax=Luteolibacter algae TaxID=454151 RepID=A0ABW5DBR1_9BACT
MSESKNTSYTLLRRAVDTADQDAWVELEEHYRRFIFYVLHGLNVHKDDIDDISQQVLISLTKDLPKYDREKSRFRTWLSTMIRNLAIDHFRKTKSQMRRIQGMGEAVVFENMGKESDLDAHIEKEWSVYIVEQAMERIRTLFKGQAMEVFELSMEDIPASEIAERTGLAVSSVYTLKKRVKKALYLEIQELTANLEP